MGDESFCGVMECAPKKRGLRRLFHCCCRHRCKKERGLFKRHKGCDDCGWDDCGGYVSSSPWVSYGSWGSAPSFDGMPSGGEATVVVPSMAEPPVAVSVVPAPAAVAVPVVSTRTAKVATPPAPAPVAAGAPPVVRVLASGPARPLRPSTKEIEDLAASRPSAALLSRGFSNYWEGRYTAALAHFEGALVKDPSNPHTWYGKALAERAIGDRAAASDSLARAVRLQKEVHIPDAEFNFLLERLPSAEKSWVRAAHSND
jgi:hypothetical protein